MTARMFLGKSLSLALFAAALVPCAQAANSPLSILPEGFGLEISPYGSRERALGEAGMAAPAKQGLSLANPSMSAFHDKTSFTASFESDLDYLRDSRTSNGSVSFLIPSMAMNFSTRRYGNLGIYYYERFHRNFSYVSPNLDEGRTAEGALYEIAADWAYAFSPSWGFALGYHYVLGDERDIKTKNFNQNPSDSLLYNGKNLDGDTLSTRSYGWYPSLSVTFRQKKFSLAARGSLAAELNQKIEQSATGLLSGKDSSTRKSIPWTIALGAGYRLRPNQTLLADFSWEAWKKTEVVNPAFQVGLGYEYQGMGNIYDPYYRKIAYRGGLGYERVYLEEVNDFFLTAGAGLPLGRRGNGMDVAVKYGHRGSISTNKWVEDYLAVSVSVTGVGIWGQPVRKKK